MKIENNKMFLFGSHLPVLRSLLKTYKIQKALELGSGEFSTQFLYAKIPHFFCIENDPVWYEHIKSRLAPRENFEIMLHKISLKKSSKTTTHDQMKEVESFYKLIKEKKFDLVFIDNFKALRPIAINVFNGSKTIVVHDSENDLYREAIKNIRYGYIHVQFACLAVRTDILTQLPIDNVFINLLNKESRKYARQYQKISSNNIVVEDFRNNQLKTHNFLYEPQKSNP